MDLVKKLYRQHDPDILFIEPSEMVVTKEIRDVANMGRRDIKYIIGPLITLVDGPMFGPMWQERENLMRGQINGADVVAVSRSDRLAPADLDTVLHCLKEMCRHPLTISATHNVGMDSILETITNLQQSN